MEPTGPVSPNEHAFYSNLEILQHVVETRDSHKAGEHADQVWGTIESPERFKSRLRGCSSEQEIQVCRAAARVGRGQTWAGGPRATEAPSHTERAASSCVH